MNAERQRGAVRGNVVEQLTELVRAPPHHVQDRTEHFLPEFGRAVEFNDRGRDVGAASRRRCLQAKEHGATRFHRGDPAIQSVPGLGIDHRTNMRRRIARIAQLEFADRTSNHVEYAISSIILHAQ